jgi:hypothetical protein
MASVPPDPPPETPPTDEGSAASASADSAADHGENPSDPETPNDEPAATEQAATTDGEAEEGTDEPAAKAAAPASPEASGTPAALTWLADRYLSIDRRLLGIFRLYFGGLLLVDVLRRMPDSTIFYSNDGILSNHFSLYAPLAKPYFSLFNALSTPNEVKIGMALTALVYCFYIAGYRTKLFQILAVILYASLNARNIFLENGGCITVGIVAVWSLFLPLGDRFSVDAVLKSLRSRRDFTADSLNDRQGLEPPPNKHTSLVPLAVALQIAVIYFFNTVHKHGTTWKNGEAIHWVLWQNRIATMWTAILRMHEPSWLSPVMSKMALVIEGSAAALVLSPVGQKYTRTLLFLSTTSLHLGIALLMTLGPFSYVMIALNMLMLPPEVFDAGAKWLAKGKVKRTVVYDATDAGLHLVARCLARLDTFGLLTFVDKADTGKTKRIKSRREGAPSATIATWTRSTKEWSVGTAAIIDALRSLPAAGLWLVLLGNPVGQALLRALLRRRTRLAASFGLEPGRAFGKKGFAFEPTNEPTPLSEQVAMTRLALRESGVFILLIAFVFQVGQDNWWLPASLRLKQPAVLQPLVLYPRMLQGWSMFSPDAPKQDGTIVVDGITADGKHLDPFTGEPPDFDAPLHGPWFQSQLWCDYFLKISFDGNKGYRDELKKYLFNWQRLKGRPSNERLVSFEVYWVSNDAPPPGQTTPTNIKKRLLLSSK